MDAERIFSLLGGDVEIVLYDVDTSISEDCFEEIYQEGLRLQKIFNFFDPKSELSLLNKKRTLCVSEELLYVIKIALRYCTETNGLYDITKGVEIRDRKEGNSIKPVSCTYKDIKISKNQIILLHPEVCIDLGSIAKGFIVDKLIEFIKLKGVESAFIDARGDMRIFGKHIEVVGVQHPRKKKNASFPIVLENKAIATSGDYNQFYGNKNKCHIIGKNNLVSVTVIADTLMEADVLATCIFLLGENEAKPFLSQRKSVYAFIFNENLEESSINGFKKYFLEDCKQ